MKLRALASLLIWLVPAVRAQTTTFQVVNAASYANAVGPASLASIFGSNLSTGTASATLDANGNLPVELASTRVEVNGSASPLIYVSPTQINFVVPAGTSTGTATVVIRSTVSNITRTSTAFVANTAPAIFSSDASGAGPGAILNAVTYTGAPFLVETAANGGSDLRTCLAVYGTGFRNAKSPSATAKDSSGNSYSLAVEFAGAAPGFFGLDQLNVVLPAQFDGAGVVSLTVSTEDGTANTVTFQMNLLAPSQLRLVSLALSPTTVIGGDSMTATVALNGVARVGGFAVSLQSSSLSVQVPPFVNIPQGKVSAQTMASTITVNTAQTGTLTAQALGATASVGFEIDPPNQAQVGNLTVTPTSVLGGRNLTGVVTLTGPAPNAGVNAQITSDNPNVRPPASVNVPFAQSSATFTIPTTGVNAAQTANITATLGNTSATVQVQVLPLLSLSLDAVSVIGGAQVNGTVALAEAPSGAGATIQLFSSDMVTARVPTTVTVLPGQPNAVFQITTATVTGVRNVTISATYSGVTASVMLAVNPQPPAALGGISMSPDTIPGGQSTQGTITLTAPAGTAGLIVTLSSSFLAVAQVQPTVLTIPAGQSSAFFTVQTSRVAVAQTVTITATALNVSKSAVLTVQP